MVIGVYRTPGKPILQTPLTQGATPTSVGREVVIGLDKALSWFERCRWAERGVLFWTIVLSFLSLSTACPDYRHFRLYSGSPWAAEALEWKFKHPLDVIPVGQFATRAGPQEAGIAEQLEKRSYRIAIPLVAKLLGTNTRAILLAQQFGAVLFLGLTLVLAREVVADRISALFVGILIATSFVGQWGFNDFNNFDGLAYLFLLLALYTRSGFLMAALMTFGGLCDERVILASPLVWVWHAVRGGELSVGPCREHSCVPCPVHVGLLLGLIGFAGIRLWLGHRWGHWVSTSGMSPAVVKNNLLWLPLALVCCVKGAVLLFLPAAFLLIMRGKIPWLIIGALAWAPGLVISLAVYDLTRSLSYGFPMYFIALGVLARVVSVQELRRLLFCAALVCVVLPTYWVLLRVYFVLPVVRFL